MSKSIIYLADKFDRNTATVKYRVSYVKYVQEYITIYHGWQAYVDQHETPVLNFDETAQIE